MEMAPRMRQRSGSPFTREFVSPLPFPTQVISNEEFLPSPQTPRQAMVETLALRLAESAAARLNVTRRNFLRRSGGMAAVFLAMNSVFGKIFDVLDAELFDVAAATERRGDPFFIFDVQTHYVSTHYDPTNAESKREGAVAKDRLLALRRRIREAGWNPALLADTGTMKDLSWETFIKEVFLDSDTTIGLISTPPGPYPQEAVVPPKEMAHIRDEVNRVAGSQRMLAHGLATPQLGAPDLEFMELQVASLKIDAWKCYTGSCPKGFDRGWWMSDERIAYPMLEKARALKVPRVCVHKGLPLGPVPNYNHPKDLIQAAKDFPDLDFLVYHSGLLTSLGIDETFAKTGAIPWTTEFCRMKQAEPELGNIYMELGSTFAQLVVTHPAICAHLLGQLIQAFGVDHVLWGTDSIWYGTPQWQIEAFRRFEIPEPLVEAYGYQPLTRSAKERIFGLNAAKLFGIDVAATHNRVPADYLGRIRMAYHEEGPLPSHRWYGWVAG